jgi:hypothetical protein
MVTSSSLKNTILKKDLVAAWVACIAHMYKNVEEPHRSLLLDQKNKQAK